MNSLLNLLQNPLERRILFYFGIFGKISGRDHIYLSLNKEELLKKLHKFEKLNLIEIGKEIKLTRLGYDVIKLDIIFLDTFFELVEAFLKDLSLKDFFIEKSKLPCVYYDALSRAIKLFLYFVHNYKNSLCSLEKRDLFSTLNHSKDCEVCKLMLVTLKQDEVLKPVIERLIEHSK